MRSSRRSILVGFALAGSSCTVASHFGRRVAPPITAAPASTTASTSARPETIRFAVLGDAGTGTQEQYAVAGLMATYCSDCSFALTLGDNVYSSGVDSPDDEALIERFERPYDSLDFPFYVALGNHDYGLWGIAPPSIAEKKARSAIAYGSRNPRWILPAQYYAFDVRTNHHPRLARFIALDTTRIAWHTDAEQQRWVATQTSRRGYEWRIAFGHHPYVSNGEHGNAGDWGNDLLSGDDFRRFVEQRLCGKVDVYFCGHDHLLEWHHPQCGTEFVVSGAGGKFDPPRGAKDSYFVSRGVVGFLAVELSAEHLAGTFYTTRGAEFRRVVKR